jgi:hypothetical protein
VKRLILVTLCLLLAACGHTYGTLKAYHARDYQLHKQTMWIKVHWNLQRPDKDTIVADGFVEPYNPKFGIHDVDLTLVGLDGNGDIINKASGRPADTYIASPLGSSPFRITMKLKGGENKFTITGSYYYDVAGTVPTFGARSVDFIPLSSDEPY